jgi:murein DD-endopeptidase MepM/ murein hydrolase activator NlpD
MTNLMIRAALVAAAATLATACASTPQYPTVAGREPGTGPQAPRPAYPVKSSDSDSDMIGDRMPALAPSTRVESETLPAVAPSASSAAVETAALPPVTAPEPAPEPQPRDEAPPEPVMVPVTRTVTLAPGKVVDVDGRPKTYTVKEGQGLDAVARAMGSSRAELAKINDLKEPYRLKPGQVLKGPASRAKAYVVASGDTLIAIGRRFGLSAAALAEENDFAATAAIRVGQKIKLPPGAKDAGPQKKSITVMEPAPGQPAPAPRPQPVTPPPAPRPQPVAPPPAVTPRPVVPTPAAPRAVPTRPTPAPTPTPAPSRPVVTPPPAVRPPVATPTPAPARPSTTAPLLPDDRPPTLTDADITALGRGRFDWPVRGELISDFGPKGGGRRNDGLDIAAPTGTPVRAAAAGKVVYSGGDVPGFGVTVLIQHEDGWVTVYGNLQTASVRMQQVVRAGEQIGAVGASGGAPRPQLHFEVRYSPSPKFKAKAIDPALVLPR